MEQIYILSTFLLHMYADGKQEGKQEGEAG